MIDLTEEQRQELEQSHQVYLRDPRTNETYILVPSAVYERLKTLLTDEPGWVEDGYRAAMEVFAKDGWEDPRMDVYDTLDPRRQA